MTYDELVMESGRLTYREKFRLAQLLIQLARKEEEQHHPEKRQAAGPAAAKLEPGMVKYVGERLRKLRPSRREALLNSIGAMFQFRGGISDGDKERIVSALQKGGFISIGGSGRVEYPEV